MWFVRMIRDGCESKGTAMSTLYPVRKKLKDALATWKPEWASKVSRRC